MNEQLSEAVGGIQLTCLEHEFVNVTVVSEGQEEITGAISSITLTINEHEEVFPSLSLAV